MNLRERIAKRIEQERSIAENSRVVAELLKPERDRWDSKPRVPYNVYAVRMQIDHANSAKRDLEFAEDLEALLAFAPRPIMEAPLDGTTVIVIGQYCGEARARAAFWSEDEDGTGAWYECEADSHPIPFVPDCFMAYPMDTP